MAFSGFVVLKQQTPCVLRMPTCEAAEGSETALDCFKRQQSNQKTMPNKTNTALQKWNSIPKNCRATSTVWAWSTIPADASSQEDGIGCRSTCAESGRIHFAAAKFTCFLATKPLRNRRHNSRYFCVLIVIVSYTSSCLPVPPYCNCLTRLTSRTSCKKDRDCEVASSSLPGCDMDIKTPPAMAA